MPPATHLRIVLAEGKEDPWKLLRVSLRNEPSIQIVGATREGHSLLNIFSRKSPDAVIIDLHLPGMGGLEAAARIRHLSPRTYIVMLTRVSWPTLEAQALAHGANALADRTSLPRVLELLRDLRPLPAQDHELSLRAVPAQRALSRLAWPA